MRTILPFNDQWLFAPEPLDARTPDDRFKTVTLPHTTVELPHRNFDPSEYGFISTYRKRFTMPEPAKGRRVFIEFDAAMIAATVSINGVQVGINEGGYTPFSFDLTEHLRGGENLLQVELDSSERADIPPFGYVVDYLTFSGIYRDVRLVIVDNVHVENVFTRTSDVLTAPKLSADVRLRNANRFDRAVNIRATLHPYLQRGSANAVTQEVTALVPPDGTLTTTLHFDNLSGIHLWSLDDPKLYTLEIEVTADSGLIDTFTTRFGFREAIFKDDGFYLNGSKIKLIGLNRHQMYPYIGAAAPQRLQCRDAEILKYDLGVNIVRTSHYPQSPHFIDACDQLGLLVLEEIPGWQFIGDEDWKGIVLRDVEAMIMRDRNHPSIVLWGVRINESWDDEALYTATNALAHKLDPTRQTGGIRYFLTSQFLEDVFTYNDFSNTVVEPSHTPHLVTEHNGHMFSTKTFDNEERQVEHALRHLRVQDKQFGMPNVTGAIGWCAFDYNTHKEFGSGDRMCYHGVMDIFRLPKFAAYVYESQIDPKVRPLVRAATFWTPGDRAANGNDPLVVFSNCDELEVYLGDKLYGRFLPDRETYPSIPHAPFVVKGLAHNMTHWGENYFDLHLVGLIDGKPAAEQWIEANSLPVQLVLEADDTELDADGADMTRLVFKVTDKYGNRLPYAIMPINFTLEGAGDLVGENPFPLVGGQGAMYVRAHTTPGTITVTASTPRLPSATVTIVTR
ncbi:MAG: glycoside hydrolase family 2 protein [Chloroflexi bacterium]|uniref:glycoside hydrolase family 2 TIM barrel-domain containing protein n=1 Tax=Candidatus Flexifilum breve TaxID=3140694 RepID=UPI00313713B2|nr:glycoside hydrolase family 2 protein [Chloroflexota bacterium]